MTRSRMVVLAMLICATFLAGAGYFATHQTIWIDETTQLSGLALPLGEQLRWLLGMSDLQLGVPLDRMPPVSYWMGSLWAGIFGLSETTMRWFGITMTLVGAPALYLAGRMRGGAAGGLFAMAVVLLSPNVLVLAGDIRAYPLFLTFSAWSVWAFLRCLDDRAGHGNARLVTLSVFLVLTSYTHFYGVVFASVLLTSLLIQRILTAQSVRPILLTGLFTAVVLAGLTPFVFAATALSGEEALANVTTLREAVAAALRLVYRLFLHGSHTVYTAVLLATALGLMGIAILTALQARLGFSAASWREQKGVFLLLPLLLAGTALFALELRIGSFSVLASHYNLWMVTLSAVFLAGAFAKVPGRSWRNRAATFFAVIALSGQVAAAAILLRHAPLYSHGPGEWVAGLWQDTQRPVIIHDDAGSWAHVYFPVHYLSEGAAIQLLARDDGTLWRILPEGLAPITGPVAQLSASDHVLRVRVESMSSDARAQIIRGNAPCEPEPPANAERGNSQSFCALAAAAVAIETRSSR